jgi:acylphosphatase
VTTLVDWAHRGPAGARVSRVEVTKEQPEGLSGFRVV